MAQNLGSLFIDGENLPIVDISSSNIGITNNGVTLDANIKKYGESSLYLDRDNEDHLTLEESNIFDILGNQAITFDVWIYPKDLLTTPRQQIFEAGYGPRWFLRLDKPVIEFRRGSNHSTSSQLLSGDFSYLTENSWNHIAITRNTSGFFTMYINGISIDTIQYGTQMLTVGTSRVGTYGTTVNPFYGNLDNLRLVKDAVLWTENFDLTEEALFYGTSSTYVRPDLITQLYGIGSRGNLRGKALEGFIRPTISQYFTSENFEEIDAGPPTPISYTTDRCNGGTAIGPGLNLPWGFDNLLDHGWVYLNAAPTWLGYKFGSGNDKIIRKYTIATYGGNHIYMPKSWTFQGSEEGSIWVDLDTRSNIPFAPGEKAEFEVNNETSFQYHRIYVTEGHSTSRVAIYEMEMMEGTYE